MYRKLFSLSIFKEFPRFSESKIPKTTFPLAQILNLIRQNQLDLSLNGSRGKSCKLKLPRASS